MKTSNKEIEQHIKEILNNVLPESFNKDVRLREKGFGGPTIRIGASPSTFLINNVAGQLPQYVSLMLWLDEMELRTQVVGGMGGGGFYRNIRPDLYENEKYLALGRVKIPFRKPKKLSAAKPNREDVLPGIYNGIEKFFTRYVDSLKEWGDDLMHKDQGDYSFLNDL